MTRDQFDVRIEEVVGAGKKSDDVMQDTLLRIYDEHLYTNLDNNITTAKFKSWVRGCCENTRKRNIQLEARKKETSAGLLGAAVTDVEGGDAVDIEDAEGDYLDRLIEQHAQKPEELIRDVQKALSQFEEPLRSDLYDFWTSAVTIAEIAKERNESYAAVQKRIHRASDKLRQSLADYEGSSAGRSTKTWKEAV